jgi:hypothetical protein
MLLGRISRNGSSSWELVPESGEIGDVANTLKKSSSPKRVGVNVGTLREFKYGGRPARSAIWKSPVVGRIAVRGVNLPGDEHADREAYYGPDKAVYAYAATREFSLRPCYIGRGQIAGQPGNERATPLAHGSSVGRSCGTCPGAAGRPSGRPPTAARPLTTADCNLLPELTRLADTA